MKKDIIKKNLVYNIGWSVLRFNLSIVENVTFRDFSALTRKFEAKKQRLRLYTMKKLDFYRLTILNGKSQISIVFTKIVLYIIMFCRVREEHANDHRATI